MTSSAIGTGINTASKLRSPALPTVTFDSNESHGTKTIMVDETTLAKSIKARVGLTNIHTFFRKLPPKSFTMLGKLS